MVYRDTHCWKYNQHNYWSIHPLSHLRFLIFFYFAPSFHPYISLIIDVGFMKHYKITQNFPFYIQNRYPCSFSVLYTSYHDFFYLFYRNRLNQKPSGCIASNSLHIKFSTAIPSLPTNSTLRNNKSNSMPSFKSYCMLSPEYHTFDLVFYCHSLKIS